MKVAIVTGSTKGVGKAIGKKLLEANCRVIFNYAHDDQAANNLNEELDKKYRGRFLIVKSELSSFESMEYFIDTIKEFTSSVDYILLNAGITTKQPFSSITKENWNSVINTNLTIPFFMVQQLSNIINDEGRIIFIGSILGKYPHSISLPYGISKSAIPMMAKYLVKEFKNKNVTVNTITPGFVNTSWHMNKPIDLRTRIESKIANGKFAEPEEVANLCMHVISNNYINGSEICIDGGYCFE